jgi:spermidine synthase
VQQRLERPEYAPVAESLRGIEIRSVIDLLSTYAGQASDFAPWVEGAEINRDRNLRLQYLAGSTLEDDIFREMIGYRRPPANLFAGSPLLLNSLLASLSLPNEGQ